MKFTNPIIPGFAPDPSIVLVERLFYLVNSSFHIFPGLPIYTSRDLQHWTLEGHALCRTSQLSLSGAFNKLIQPPNSQPVFITGGLFAPTIRFFQGRFYIVCTNTFKDPDGTSCYQNFLISCEKGEVFSGGWSDPILFDFPGIDPGLFFDASTGKAYLHGSYRTGPAWAPNCSIRQFEIDVKTGEALSPCKLLWEGAAKQNDAEGPHIYRKDDCYYLLTAEGSTFEGHQINIARSRNIWGPYDSCPKNPILTAEGKQQDVRWTGHGDLFQDCNGNWFCVHLGIRHDGLNGERHPLGRETFLTPVTWPKDDWPTVFQTQLEFEIEDEKIEMPRLTMNGEDAAARHTGIEDIHIRTPNLDDYKYSPDQDTYLLRARPQDLSTSLGTSTFLGRRQRSVTGTTTVTVELDSPRTQGELFSGLSVYKDRYRHCSLSFSHHTRQISVHLVALSRDLEQASQLGCFDIDHGTKAIDLRIVATKERYEFLWRPHSSAKWQSMASVDAATFSGLDMTGTIYGISASCDEANGGSLVRFRNFSTP